MNAWVLLLRGLNVGGHGKLTMADLKAILATLGARDIETYIQSGNAIFTGVIDARGFGELVETEIQTLRGFRPHSLVISADTFGDILAGYPWPEARDDPTSGHIWFLANTPPAPELDKIAESTGATERTHLGESAFYLHAPDGIGRSKLASRAERLLGVPATARNLNTALKLNAMLAPLRPA